MASLTDWHTHSFTDWHIKILRYFQKWWGLELLHIIGLGVWPTEKIEKPKICLSKYIKKYRKISAILYNWKTADRIEEGFSLNKRANELRISLTNTTHEAVTVSEISYFNWRQLGLCEKLFSLHFSMTLNNIEKKIIQKYWLVHEKVLYLRIFSPFQNDI